MIEWFRNIDWNKELEDTFELKLKRARGNNNKAQYLRIQASYLLDSQKFGNIGEKLMKRLFTDFPNETFSLVPGHEQLGDYYFKIGRFDLAEIEYTIVINRYHTVTRSNTSGIVDIKLAELILLTSQKDRYCFAYKLITDDFLKSNGYFGLLNCNKYYLLLIRSKLAKQLGLK
jgi:hypothetical protein